MAPAKQKRKKKSKGRRVKTDLGAIKPNGNSSTVRTGHVVCVTSVPSALCASERTVRDFFAEYGMLLSVTVRSFIAKIVSIIPSNVLSVTRFATVN